MWHAWLKLCAVGLCSNRGPHGELFLLPRMEEMHRLHEVIKIDFHTPAIIRNAGRTLAARDVVDILRVYIAVLHRVVGGFDFLLYCEDNPLGLVVPSVNAGVALYQTWCLLVIGAIVAFCHSWFCLSPELVLSFVTAVVAFHQS